MMETCKVTLGDILTDIFVLAAVKWSDSWLVKQQQQQRKHINKHTVEHTRMANQTIEHVLHAHIRTCADELGHVRTQWLEWMSSG